MTQPKPLDCAREFLERGWMPLPIPFKSKNPNFRGWQKFSITEEALASRFNGQPQNIGVLLGEPSGGLIDIDLDSMETIHLALSFLPSTDTIFGRASKPRSHFLYLANPIPATTKFKDIDGTMLVELRSTGQQTVLPPSTHPSAERIEWEKYDLPARLEGNELLKSVSRLAAAAIIARHYPSQGSRQDAALALAGGLLRAGWANDAVEHFIKAICDEAQDEETSKRVQTVCATARSLAAGEYATGWPTLSKLIGNAVTKRVREWLGIKSTEKSESNLTQEQIHKDDPSYPYITTGEGLARYKQTKDGDVLVKLCNFQAEITDDITEDDGTSERRIYKVQGRLAGQESYSTTTVSADEFGLMKWADKLLGATATIHAGQTEYVRCAVKLLSKNITRSKIFTHTGWRKFDDGFYYLHGGGAIGESGNNVNISVQLPDSLSRFVLPDALEKDALTSAVRHHLEALEVSAPSITFPLFGGVWASILGRNDFALHLVGTSGVGKSELAAIAQAHFGAGFDREHLPASWSSTGNSLERLAHSAKDAVLVVDDFAPTGTATDTARMHRDADRLLRAQGNHAGRLRLRSDTSFNNARAPRGLIISTGEDIPRGQSLQARMFTLEIERASAKGSVDFSVLTRCQEHAREGIYAGVMAAFIKWLSPRYSTLGERARDEIADLRNEASARSEGHKRHATTAAKLMHAWNWFLDFALDIGAMQDEERDRLSAQAWEAILDTAKKQETHQASQDPATRFVELISAALSTGAAHIARHSDGREPDACSAMLGWRGGEAQGKHIGWTDGTHIYLQPDIAFAVANELSSKTGSSLTVTPTTLWKRLHERGWLTREESQDTLKQRVTIEGQRIRVISILFSKIIAGE
jgi:hypothetical protein